MLTRLKVSGFKNLLDVDVRFGPFTCIVGLNGVGKSNLFDAIHFLSLLADRPLMEAAASVRDSGRRLRDVSELFYRSGEYVAPQMDFEVEILVPPTAEDDFSVVAEATNTLLRYSLSIGHRATTEGSASNQLVLIKEELKHIPIKDAKETLLFQHSEEWRESAVAGLRIDPFFISTDNNTMSVKIHQDGGKSSRTLSIPSGNLKRTVLANSNTAESPTILVLRREMQSWLQLQLEPSSLRKADEFTDPPHLTASGEHLPATLDRLATFYSPDVFYATLANRLAELVGGVDKVIAVRDTARQLISAQVTFQDGTPHPASSLSDGTLRFLALAALEQDPEFSALLCLEEPENGIHPELLPVMIRLLDDLAMDVMTPIGSANPLRQVIVNTHSPTCVAEVQNDSLLYAQPTFVARDSQMLPTIRFQPLSKTWRSENGDEPLSKGTLIRYLRPVPRFDRRGGRVADREDVQLELDFAEV